MAVGAENKWTTKILVVPYNIAVKTRFGTKPQYWSDLFPEGDFQGSLFMHEQWTIILNCFWQKVIINTLRLKTWGQVIGYLWSLEGGLPKISRESGPVALAPRYGECAMRGSESPLTILGRGIFVKIILPAYVFVLSRYCDLVFFPFS